MVEIKMQSYAKNAESFCVERSCNLLVGLLEISGSSHAFHTLTSGNPKFLDDRLLKTIRDLYPLVRLGF